MNNLSVGIKNALERGERLDSAIQSLENAGYSKEEVNKAVQEVQQWDNQELQKPITEITNSKDSQPKEGYKKLLSQPTFEINSSKNYTGYVLIILLGLLFIIGAALLGLYWDKLF
jgi:hypothetical protein